MAVFLCPFCGATIPISKETQRIQHTNFQHLNNRDFMEDDFVFCFYFCPNCFEEALAVNGTGKFLEVNQMIFPKEKGRNFPEYVPSNIINDYEESFSIVSLSPKASATLSRRCLQSMIRDFWDINIPKPSLYKEIKALEGKISPQLIEALLSFKSIANIGAHPETDINIIIEIEQDEAMDLIKLIEFLIGDWYIKRCEQESLLESINHTSNEKKNQREINQSTP